jgi:hypothetical protein
MMNEHGKSDKPILPEKSPNKAGRAAAEGMEGRGLAKGNSRQQNAFRTQGREDVHSALGRVRAVARKNKDTRFTALFHYVYDLEMLEVAYFCLKKEAAPGVDGETWRHYGEDLEQNLQDLSHRLQRGAYHAKPVRRTYIPKSDGRQRPLGVTALEDKIVQRAAVEVLNAIYEEDFADFSYGFRPGRSQHDALDQLYLGIYGKKVNWVLDLDICSFFDSLSQNWLVEFVEHRIGDRRVVHLIQKWLRAGVLEDGKVTVTEEGTPQGGSASPLLANIYLHYGAPGQTWCFQRVKFPPRQEVQPPHRESSLGSEEVTNRTKRRQSDERAVTKVKRLSLVKYLTAGRQHRSGWEAPVGTPQTARWPETAAGSESTARSDKEASRDLGDPLWSWSIYQADRVCRTIRIIPEKGRCCSAKSGSPVVLRARESRVQGEAAKQMKTDFRETSPAPTEAGV